MIYHIQSNSFNCEYTFKQMKKLAIDIITYSSDMQSIENRQNEYRFSVHSQQQPQEFPLFLKQKPSAGQMQQE